MVTAAATVAAILAYARANPAVTIAAVGTIFGIARRTTGDILKRGGVGNRRSGRPSILTPRDRRCARVSLCTASLDWKSVTQYDEFLLKAPSIESVSLHFEVYFVIGHGVRTAV